MSNNANPTASDANMRSDEDQERTFVTPELKRDERESKAEVAEEKRRVAHLLRSAVQSRRARLVLEGHPVRPAACACHVRGESGTDLPGRSRRHMSPQDSAKIIQAGLLVAGLGTCLQLYGIWLFGSRLPMVTGISFTYVAAAISIVSHKGYGAVVGAVMVGGLLEVVLGLTARYWQRFVPPIVSAIVVTSIGFSLLSVGAESFGGGAGAEDFGSWQNLTLGLISLVACLAFQLFMKGTAKQLSVLFGLVVGYIVAIFFGKVDFSGFSHLQAVNVPTFMPFRPEFDWGSIISIGLLYIVSSVEVLGDTAALTKVGLDRKPTAKETSGAIAGDGLISSVSGLFGCLPLTSFAQNIGLVAMTKVVNRKVILSGGLLLVLASFVPAISEVFNSMPQAVLGGCTIMMFGNIILSGFQMISDAGYTQRNITIAALSLTIGIGFTQVSSIFVHFPPLFQSIFAQNCIAVAFVVAVVLNLVLPSKGRFPGYSCDQPEVNGIGKNPDECEGPTV